MKRNEFVKTMAAVPAATVVPGFSSLAGTDPG